MSLAKKGKLPKNFQLLHTPESNKKRGEKLKGERNPMRKKENQEKVRIAMLGRKLSEETKKKISESEKGKKLSPEHIKILKEIRKGNKSNFWKGGISTYERKLYLNSRRWARKKGAEGSHTFGEWKLLKKQYGFVCPACKRKEPEIKLTEDHIIPLSKGGSDYIENIQPLCKNCNSKKYNKIQRFTNLKAKKIEEAKL